MKEEDLDGLEDDPERNETSDFRFAKFLSMIFWPRREVLEPSYNSALSEKLRPVSFGPFAFEKEKAPSRYRSRSAPVTAAHHISSPVVETIVRITQRLTHIAKLQSCKGLQWLCCARILVEELAD